jgi:hypothetical protein
MYRAQKMTSPATGLRLRWLPLPVVVATAAVAITNLAAAPAAFANADEQERGVVPGCASNRPAIAHRAGGLMVRPDNDEKAPIPCSTNTRWRTSEISIAVTNEGTVLFQPTLPAAGLPIGLIRSVDQGLSWTFVPHSAVGTPVTDPIDQNLWVDRETGRVFWISIDLPSPTPARLDRSDDDGKTWFPSNQPCPNRAFNPLGCGHPQVFTGPPTESMEHLLQGYPNVVYVCGGGAGAIAPPGTIVLACQKSVDGGSTWGPAVPIPTPAGVSCAVFNNFGLNGVVGPDGTVYVPFTPCQRPYIAASHDEGATWQTDLVADTDTLGFGMLALGMDKPGNLYAAWVGAADRLPYLAISRDGGSHWSTPLMAGAPGVNEAAIPGLVVGKRGQVAITYYGSTNAPLPFPPSCNGLSTACPGYQHETWNTYITETFNALSGDPLFWSAPINNPDQPTWYGCSPSAIGLGTPTFTSCTGGVTFANVDYYGMTIAPDDTPWIGFVQECPLGMPIADNPNCDQAAGGAHDGLFGLVGRLVREGGAD